jgi:hypothetical protein
MGGPDAKSLLNLLMLISSFSWACLFCAPLCESFPLLVILRPGACAGDLEYSLQRPMLPCSTPLRQKMAPPSQEFHTLASSRRGEQLLQASALSFGPANTDSWFRERFNPSNASGPIIGSPACFLHHWNQLKCLFTRQSRTRGTGPVHSGARRVSKGHPMRLMFWRSDLSSVSIFAA